MGKILTHAICVVFALMLAVGCSSNTCRDNVSAIPQASFYSSSTQSAISIDSLTVYGVGVPGDSAIMRNEQASQVHLPFRGGVESCQFVFHYEQQALSDERLNDTLTFNYTSIPMFTSVECGAMYFYEISAYSCTNHLIDSVSLVSASVSNVEAETLRIYFRTSSGSDDENTGGGDTTEGGVS